MILIADCGSSKIDWCLIRQDGEVEKRFNTPGMNAVMLTREEIDARMLSELMPELDYDRTKVSNAFFYGAGCISEEVCGNVAGALKKILPKAKIEVHSDLLAAARAVCDHKAGIACIMGTGSNSCYYDGEKIVENVSPLGYILGDEGSGAVLGKRLVGDVLKKQLPEDLCQQFLAQYDLDLITIIHRVYRKPMGNKFLASLSPFLSEHMDCPQIKAIVVDEFGKFFDHNVSAYKHCDEVNFVGSIAHYYRDVLKEVASSRGYKIGTILRTPMAGLIKYHTN